KLVVVEKCEGGSRSALGGYQENLERIRAVFEKFGVSEHVVLFPHELNDESADRVLALLSGERIAALIHDADGRIDRDFRLFWPRLEPDGLIVVDDYENAPEKYKSVSVQHPTGGAKMVITFRLLNQLVSWGLFEKIHQKGTTVFG